MDVGRVILIVERLQTPITIRRELCLERCRDALEFVHLDRLLLRLRCLVRNARMQQLGVKRSLDLLLFGDLLFQNQIDFVVGAQLLLLLECSPQTGLLVDRREKLRRESERRASVTAHGVVGDPLVDAPQWCVRCALVSYREVAHGSAAPASRSERVRDSRWEALRSEGR